MDTTMAERLKTALAARGMTPPDLIKATGMSRAGVYFLLDGTTTAEKIRATTVAKLCKALQISREWLLFGRGAMDGSAPPEASQPGRLESEKLMAVAEAMSIVMARRGRQVDLTEQEQAELFVEAYAELTAMRDGTSNMAAGAVVADLLAVREARSRGDRERDLQVGGVSGKRDKSQSGGRK